MLFFLLKIRSYRYETETETESLLVTKCNSIPRRMQISKSILKPLYTIPPPITFENRVFRITVTPFQIDLTYRSLSNFDPTLPSDVFDHHPKRPGRPRRRPGIQSRRLRSSSARSSSAMMISVAESVETVTISSSSIRSSCGRLSHEPRSRIAVTVTGTAGRHFPRASRAGHM